MIAQKILSFQFTSTLVLILCANIAYVLGCNLIIKFMEYFDHARWASAIAKRISDEWSGASDFPQDVVLLRKSLEKMLSNDLDVVTSLIGTGVIEKDYFDKLV